MFSRQRMSVNRRSEGQAAKPGRSRSRYGKISRLPGANRSHKSSVSRQSQFLQRGLKVRGQWELRGRSGRPAFAPLQLTRSAGVQIPEPGVTRPDCKALIHSLLARTAPWTDQLRRLSQRLIVRAKSLRSLPKLAGSVAPTGLGLLIGLALKIDERLSQISRSEWELRSSLGQRPALLCVGACLVAAVITLSPSAGEFWSQQTDPAVAALDRVLAPHGVLVGPELVPEAPTSRPMIAVVFSRIMPDDSVEVPTEVAESEELRDEPQVGNLREITRPTGWLRSTPQLRVSSAAYEIRD